MILNMTALIAALTILPLCAELKEEVSSSRVELYLENPKFISSSCAIDEPETSQNSFGKSLAPTNKQRVDQSATPHLSPNSDDTVNGLKRGTGKMITNQPKNEKPLYEVAQCLPGGEGFTVNFEDISVIQFLQFVSEISGINFIFDNKDLQFKITIVSQEAASVTELTSALLQILRIHGLSVAEEGSTVLIYPQKNLSKVSKVITDENTEEACDAAVITRVFRLYNVDPEKTAAIIKPLLATDAVVDVSVETRHLIVSDITSNVDKIAQLLNALDMPNTNSEIAEYAVKGAYPAALVAYAKEILAPLIVGNPMQMIAQPSQHKIFIVSTPFLIHKALQVLESLDTADITDVGDLPAGAIANSTLYMYKLRYHNGQDIANSLRSVGTNLQSQGVSNTELVSTLYAIEFIEVNNSIIISGTDDAVKKVLSLLQELDQAPKQVYLEVLIIDTTLSNSLDFGIQWIALGDEQDKLAYASGLLANTPPNPNVQGGTTTNPGARFVAAQGTPPPVVPNPGRDVALPVPSSLQGITTLADATEAFGFGILGNIIRHNGESFLTLGALVSALEQESVTKVVLNPRILVEDTQPADILVGQNIPYQTTSTVVQQTGSVTQNIQYEDIGVHLRVTPTISPNNVVTFQIDQSVTELVSIVGTLTPTTSKTNATTRVHVPDGCFVVMSGHIRDNVTSIRSGVPCLGSLPLVGPAFSRTVDQREKRNMIMFIRPKVMSSVNDALEITNQEGYDHNWEANPCSLKQCGQQLAPECETYPPQKCPSN